MDISLYVILGTVVAFTLVTTFFITRLRVKDTRKKIPESYFGAIRVTSRDGKDMLIVKKDDGTFEMVDEQAVKRQ